MKAGISFLSFALAFVLTACGPSQKAPVSTSGEGIIGGVEVESDDPIAGYTALLVNTDVGSICTVSVLNEYWMLTAAHCVEGSAAKDFVVIFDRSPLGDLGASDLEKRGVEIVKAHPRFQETMDILVKMDEEARARGDRVTDEEVDAITDWGDVALVKLSEAAPASAAPATLLALEAELTAQQPVLVAGYGITDGAGGGAGTLRKVDVTIEKPVWGTSEVLLNQKSGKGACRGDSGGPAYVEDNGELQLFGITSRGVMDKERSCLNYAAYTDLRNYSDWIAETMAGSEAQTFRIGSIVR